MKRKSILALTVAATLSTAIALPALAGGNHGHGAGPAAGRHSSMGMMSGQGGMADMDMMHSRMGGMRAGGHGMGMMAGPLFQSFDADDDGTVSPEEARAGLLDQLKSHDSDSNGTLSIEEFETLHAAATRTRMVDRFQALDEDGNGEVTEDEITTPAKRMGRMQQMRRMMQGEGDGDGSETDDN